MSEYGSQSPQLVTLISHRSTIFDEPGLLQAMSTVDANQAVVTGLIQSLTSQPSVTVGEALKEASSKVDATELRSLSTNMVLYGLPMLGP
jgi:hypothetical protein